VPGPPTQEFLSLNSLHQQVRSALRKKHLPEPHRHDPDNIGQLPHFHNNMSRRRSPRAVRPRATRTWRLPNSPFRVVLGAGLGVLIVLVAVLLGTRPWAPGPSAAPSPTSSAPPLGGVDMAGYCSTLGAQGSQVFRVAGTNCIQKIDLNKACDYSYHTTGLKAEFGSSDLNSAYCVNPKTNRESTGIAGMPKYCGTLIQGTGGVTATSNDPYLKNHWVCKAAIDMNVACVTQYHQASLVARHVDGTWSCYPELPIPGVHLRGYMP
jgi:hypothetical protein